MKARSLHPSQFHSLYPFLLQSESSPWKFIKLSEINIQHDKQLGVKVDLRWDWTPPSWQTRFASESFQSLSLSLCNHKLDDYSFITLIYYLALIKWIILKHIHHRPPTHETMVMGKVESHGADTWALPWRHPIRYSAVPSFAFCLGTNGRTGPWQVFPSSSWSSSVWRGELPTIQLSNILSTIN